MYYDEFGRNVVCKKTLYSGIDKFFLSSAMIKTYEKNHKKRLLKKKIDWIEQYFRKNFAIILRKDVKSQKIYYNTVLSV